MTDTWVRRARRHTIGDTLRRSRLRHPDKPALKWKDEEVTYRELDERVNRLANGLLAAGVEKGDRIAMLSKNCLDFAVVWFAVARAGAVFVPINFMLGAEEVRYILEHSQSAGFFVAPDLLETAEKAVEGLDFVRYRGLVDTPESRGPWRSVADWSAGQPETEPDVDIDDGDVVNILYTSGTESRPKGAMLTHRSLIAEYVSGIIDGELTAEDRIIHALPLFHSAQFHVLLGPQIYLGAWGVIVEGAAPELVMETVSRERVTQLFCPPTVWISLLRHPRFDEYDLSSLQKCYYGAAIMPVEVLKELTRRLPGARFWNAYGQTEVAPLAMILRPEDQLRKPGAAGKPCINVESKIVDDEGREVPPGTVGEIVHRTPHAMIGYYNDPEKTAAAFEDGWFHSGDLGVMDEDGYFTVVDRKKDMIKTGGENVASREVEEAIYQHPGVAEVAVIGVPHPYWIEAVTAVVVPKAGSRLTEEELIAFCRERLAGFKVPKFVVITEALPKNPSGKILKRQLRDVYQHLGERPVS
ncbi:acyl-CoA synthetase [Kyrpidia tusciae]|uniref:AMP-dependent synthetase and ligase n=1 Tax=Kyrpidia tusciae (strain DSM 2912 / NBRC 15312 / T2) TaxID=562970 RepID=D5WU46_KYRT2|nr:acyl-CoA synthetase [Kyrpidia tusciae]ADG07298.1 AMP-dependent synthetase and ligase [Kyrpidia tusciae DSM 2912]